MHTYTTTIEIEVDVTYEYDPGEPTVFNYGDGSGHPVSPPFTGILSVVSEGVNIIDALPASTLECLECDTLENHDTEEDYE